MIQKKNIALAIVLTIVTCGIYGIIWFINLTDDVNAATGCTGATSGGMSFLFSLLTCGIYMYFWMYKTGEKLDCYYMRIGMPDGSRGILYLALSLFGFGIISFALIQDSVNQIV